MKYEIVNIEQKTVVGITARTRNDSPEMGAVIGGLWQKLFEEKLFFAIPNKVNAYTIGLYSDYASSDYNEYSVTVGCEVTEPRPLLEGTIVRAIPAGRYAKYVVFGNMVKAVAEAWQTIWETPLDRSFTGDFEEYISADEQNNCEVHIYVALK